MTAAGARTIRAAVWRHPGEPGSVEDVLLEPPRAGEVFVRIAAAGVCHSDLHLADGHLGDERFPTVLGHEGAGIVESVGEGVEHVGPGDRVAFSFIPCCGKCLRCRQGRGNLCELSDRSFKGVLLDGTTRLSLADGTPLLHFLGVACFAERCVLPAASAVPVPPGLPLWQAALVGCAVVTGVGAVRNAARVGPGESVAVVGCGGVGLQVIAGARLAGADPIVAVDRTPAKLELALAHGATHAVDASAERPAREVRRIAGAGGVDHAFEVVGRPETIRLAWDCLRPGGTAVVVGLAPRGVEATVPAIDFLSEKSLRGCFYGSGYPPREIAELAGLVAEGHFDVAHTVSHLAGLDGIDEAFARMRRGEGARTVLVVDPELAGAPETL